MSDFARRSRSNQAVAENVLQNSLHAGWARQNLNDKLLAVPSKLWYNPATSGSKAMKYLLAAAGVFWAGAAYAQGYTMGDVNTSGTINYCGTAIIDGGSIDGGSSGDSLAFELLANFVNPPIQMPRSTQNFVLVPTVNLDPTPPISNPILVLPNPPVVGLRTDYAYSANIQALILPLKNGGQNTVVPEPASLALAGLGIASLFLVRRRLG